MLNESPVNLMLIGAIAMACFVASLFFFRSWRQTKDRFFVYFGTSFLIEGVNRVALGLSADPNEGAPLFYIVRFISFVLIILAIADKNFGPPQKPS
jgi:uncharacterized membrane protein HdeD (DUF308 family)